MGLIDKAIILIAYLIVASVLFYVIDKLRK